MCEKDAYACQIEHFYAMCAISIRLSILEKKAFVYGSFTYLFTKNHLEMLIGLDLPYIYDLAFIP